MSKKDDFNQLVKNFYDNNKIDENNDEKYMKGFRLRLGKFISQPQLKENQDVQKIVVDCIANDYKYYSEELIKKFFSKFHTQFKTQLSEHGWDIEKDVYFLNVLNKETYKANSSIDMVNLYIKVNQLPNEQFKQLSSVMDIEVKYERYLAGYVQYGYYNEDIYHKEKILQVESWKNRLKNKKILVLIDDYSGTGSTIDDFITKIKDYIPSDIHIFVICVHVTEDAKIRIETSLKTNNFKGQVVHYEVSQKYFKDDLINEKLIEKFEREVVRPSRKKDILGFDSTESVVTTYRNTPNNTLSLFWSENPNEISWRALFPRDHKDGKLHAGFSKWVTERNKVKWFMEYMQVPDENKEKAIVIISIVENVNKDASMTESELSRIICYTDDIIQECLVEQLLERTDNYYNVSSFGSAFLKSINLENSSWKKIDSEFKINGEQKEEFKFNFLS